MKHAEPWLTLFESDELARTRMVATCLSAMEFEVRLCCPRDHDLSDCDDTCGAPYSVQVPSQHFAQLADVVDELVEEQEQFDEFIDRWHSKARRAERRLVMAMIIVVGTLATIGAIEL